MSRGVGADQSSEEQLKDVLRNLTDKNEESLHRLNEGQVETSPFVFGTSFSFLVFECKFYSL